MRPSENGRTCDQHQAPNCLPMKAEFVNQAVGGDVERIGD
jgi:hypothetical protein